MQRIAVWLIGNSANLQNVGFEFPIQVGTNDDQRGTKLELEAQTATEVAIGGDEDD